jgi:protein-tyrosine phosphatase
MWRRFFGLNVSQIEPLLFVGGEFRAQQWPLLYKLGIRAVLSLQEEYSDQFIGPPPERTLRLPVTDHYAPTLEQLAEGVAFIAAAYADTLPILVHCHAGVGRAPLTAAAYLVQQRAMAPDAALVYLRAARPIVSLNQLQCCRLYEWANYTGANV